MTSPIELGSEINSFLRLQSWPGAVAPESMIRLRPQPPRAPKRGPTIASWVVPPLHLPTAPTKPDNASFDDASTNDGSGQGTARNSSPAPVCSDSDYEDGEVCVFSLDDGNAQDEDDEDLLPGPVEAKFELVGLDDLELDAAADKGTDEFDKGGIIYDVDSNPASPVLGASPVLLSAIERMAAAQKLGRQTTI